MTTRRTQPTQAASGLTPAVPLPGRIEQIWLAALVVVIGLLAVVNLPYAPRTWFDEGSHLHVPKAIVQRGMYADISATSAGEIEYRYHGPTIGIGPTIMLPVALVYKIFGVSLVGGRLVIVLYLLIGLAAAYALARRMHGGAVALLALSLLIGSRTVSYETMFGSGLEGMITNGYEGMIEYGRQVVGEVPGVAFLLLGLIAWWQALQVRGPSHVRWALLAGLGFGLTLVTKNQFVLILPPSLALIALLDWRYYRVGTWWLRVAPLLIACICYGVWTLAQFQFLGPGTFMENVQQTRQAAGGAIFVFNIRSTLRAGYYVLRPGLYGGLIIPALLYTIWCARQRSARGMVDGLMGLLIGLWVVWYVAVSLGWPRYAFPAVALSAIAIARAAVDLYQWLRRGDGWRRTIAAPALVAYLALITLVPLGLTARFVMTPDDSAAQFAAYLNANVDPAAVIETWDPELGVLTDHLYKYPPQQLLDGTVRAEWLGGTPPTYDWWSDSPDYVAVGPFSAYARVYAVEALDTSYREVFRVGQYGLYQRR